MKIINLTQHAATQEQFDAGVIEVYSEFKDRLLEALNFSTIPTVQEVRVSAAELANIMKAYDGDLTGEVKFMVGGAPYLMAELVGWAPIYNMVFAYSERVSEEQHMADGSVRKVNVFKHKGFVPMAMPGI